MSTSTPEQVEIAGSGKGADGRFTLTDPINLALASAPAASTT